MTPAQKEHYSGIARRLIAEQNFRNALIAGVIVMSLMIAIWIGIAAYTGQTMGYLAVATGAGTGYTIQVFGKGIRATFVILAFVLALVACVAGNILAVVLIESVDHQMPVTDILGVMTPRAVTDFIVVNMGLIDLAFWILAVSAAAYVARRRLNRQEQLAIFTLRHSPATESGIN